jgi:hypothetical protein
MKKVCCSLAELYVKSVYLNLLGWKGDMKFMIHVMGGGGKL